MSSRTTLESAVAAAHAGRHWVVVHEVAAAATDLVARLQEWGATGVMVVAATEGVGEQPDGVPVHFTRSTGDTLMGGVRGFMTSVEEPSRALEEAVRRFDPGRRARVIATPLATWTEVLGRPVYGARRPDWSALEDKTTVDELWAAAGIATAPSAVVPVQEASAAAAGIAGPLGSVWVADNKEGWHGGAEYVRWVRDAADGEAASAWFARHAERVRIMPFLDGIPCSVHGYVTPEATAAFRPVEMVILRRVDEPGFVYSGMATTWDPGFDVREEMRLAVRAVGEEMSRRVGYLGGFSLDGVCTADGFRPTEVNPRYTSGLDRQAVSAGLELETITRCFVEGDLSVDADWLESEILQAADSKRAAGFGLPLTDEIPPQRLALHFDGPQAFVRPPEVEGDGVLEAGPGPSGSYVKVTLDPARLVPGASIAPHAAAVARLVAQRWAADVPPVEAAPDLC